MIFSMYIYIYFFLQGDDTDWAHDSDSEFEGKLIACEESAKLQVKNLRTYSDTEVLLLMKV